MKNYRPKKDMRAIRFLTKNLEPLRQFFLDRDGPDSIDGKELVSIVTSGTQAKNVYVAHNTKRHLFVVCVETPDKVMDMVVEQYVQTAIKRFANMYKKQVDYFSNIPPPSFSVQKIFSIGWDDASKELGVREIVKEVSFLKNIMMNFYDKLDPLTVEPSEMVSPWIDDDELDL